MISAFQGFFSFLFLFPLSNPVPHLCDGTFPVFLRPPSYQHFHTTTIIRILSLPLKNDWPEFHLSCIKVETLRSSLSVVRPFLIRQMQNSNLASPLRQKFPGYLSDHVCSFEGAGWMLLSSWKQQPCVSLDPQDPAKFLLGPTTTQIADMLGHSDSQVVLEIRINLPSST